MLVELIKTEDKSLESLARKIFVNDVEKSFREKYGVELSEVGENAPIIRRFIEEGLDEANGVFYFEYDEVDESYVIITAVLGDKFVIPAKQQKQ